MRISDWSSDVCSSDLVERKAKNDFVTQVDRGAEQEIIRLIRKAYPHHAILAEESGASGDNEVTWIIDPLDGTTNFLHGIPHFAVSIGIPVRGKLEHGVIYAPCTQDLYRSEEHTSELQSLMRNSSAVFCLKKQHSYINPYI